MSKCFIGFAPGVSIDQEAAELCYHLTMMLKFNTESEGGTGSS